MMAVISKSGHILDLARELLDDIELSRLDAEKLLLKCSRLARLTGSDEIQEWIQLEISGYNSQSEVALKYMSLTGRWTDRAKNLGYWGPLAQQEANVAAQNLKLNVMRIPDPSGEHGAISVNNSIKALNVTANLVAQFSAIRSRVLGLLHKFVTETYYELEFGAAAESIFEKYKTGVDALIGEHAGNVLQKIPSVINRLAENDEEAISQALNTCRRIVDAFANSIYPPSEGEAELDGSKLKIDESKVLNRINLYVAAKTSSKSRRQKIRQNLGNLYDRVSVGVHKDVGSVEANSLFLNTYLLLGEILEL